MESLLTLENLLALVMGLGLSTACGFRVFVPLSLMSLSALMGWIHLPQELLWAASPIALVVLLSATVLEIGGYYIPWVDNLLDTLATPMAMLAGTLITFGFAPEMNPVWHWSLALIAGGGLAGITQGATVATRAISTASTGGLANPIVSSIEGVLAIALSMIAIAAPFLALAAVILVLLWAAQKLVRYARIKNPSTASEVLS